MEPHRRRVREAAAQRAEAGERRGRVSLVVAADGVGDECVDVVRRQLPGFGEGHKAEIRLDIFNFLNLLNKDWGVEHRASFPLERTLANVTNVVDGKYEYDIRPYLDGNGNYAPTALPVNENFAPSQRWAANVTLRYEF